MVVSEQIQYYVSQLPPAFQSEVLNFIEFLLDKAKREVGDQQERAEWSALSLAFAMRGMGDESEPHYTTADLKVIFV